MQRVGVVMERKEGSFAQTRPVKGEQRGGKGCLNLKNPSSARRSIRNRERSNRERREKREKRAAGLHNSNRPGGIRGIFLFVLRGLLPPG